MDTLDSLLTKLNLKFPKEPALIKEAFIHRSYLNESPKPINSNERLEFLGDSILSYLVSEYLFLALPSLPEGELTNIRSSLVKTSTLSETAKELNLGNYLLLSKGEEESGGRKNSSLLADVFEAFLGAVYLEGGLSCAKKLLDQFLFPKLAPILKEKSYKDAKSSFQEVVQDDRRVSPVYKVLKEEGPDHAKKFSIGVYVGQELWGKGTGRSKQEAEQTAAKAALEKWEKKE